MHWSAYNIVASKSALLTSAMICDVKCSNNERKISGDFWNSVNSGACAHSLYQALSSALGGGAWGRGYENSLIGRTIWARRGGAFQRYLVLHTRCDAERARAGNRQIIGRTILWARRGGAFQRYFGIAHAVRCRACKSWKVETDGLVAGRAEQQNFITCTQDNNYYKSANSMLT